MQRMVRMTLKSVPKEITLQGLTCYSWLRHCCMALGVHLGSQAAPTHPWPPHSRRKQRHRRCHFHQLQALSGSMATIGQNRAPLMRPPVAPCHCQQQRPRVVGPLGEVLCMRQSAARGWALARRRPPSLELCAAWLCSPARGARGQQMNGVRAARQKKAMLAIHTGTGMPTGQGPHSPPQGLRTKGVPALHNQWLRVQGPLTSSTAGKSGQVCEQDLTAPQSTCLPGHLCTRHVAYVGCLTTATCREDSSHTGVCLAHTLPPQHSYAGMQSEHTTLAGKACGPPRSEPCA